jgi:DNA polymerase-1
MVEVTKDHRNVAKIINFGLCYGMSASGLSSRLNIPPQQAERFINAYFRAYPQVKNTLQRLGTQAVTKRYSETLSGRKRYYGTPDSFSKQKSLERKGRNTPIQGTCGDILKKAIQYLMDDLVPYDAMIINLVHDELVLEVKNDQVEQVRKVVEEAMIRAGTFYIKSVPIEVEVVVDKVWRK